MPRRKQDRENDNRNLRAIMNWMVEGVCVWQGQGNVRQRLLSVRRLRNRDLPSAYGPRL